MQSKPVVLLNVFEIEDGERHWYAAYSKEDAKEMHRKEFEIDPVDMRGTTVKWFPFVNTLTVRADDGSERTQKAHEWIAELGEGLICSTAY